MLPWLVQSSFPVITLSYNATTRLLDVSQIPCSMWAEGNVWFIPLEVQVDDRLYTIVLNDTSACDFFALLTLHLAI